jgi:hypothetical protein
MHTAMQVLVARMRCTSYVLHMRRYGFGRRSVHPLRVHTSLARLCYCSASNFTWRHVTLDQQQNVACTGHVLLLGSGKLAAALAPRRRQRRTPNENTLSCEQWVIAASTRCCKCLVAG